MLSTLTPKLRTGVVYACSLLATTSLAQRTINVGPGQSYSTIQSGIDAAGSGDTVSVAPGIYYEDIDFKGKAITVTSSGGATQTIIDGGSKGGVATVVFANGEQNTSIISDFTIRGGGDSTFSGTSDGGIYVSAASPMIRNNIVTANYCHNIEVDFGAATILNNEVSGVLQDPQGVQGTSYCTFGSGVHLRGVGAGNLGSTIIGNTIENNLTGSGINLWAAQSARIINNIIRNNVSPDPGSAFTEANSLGTVMFQNLIYRNVSKCGGAIAFMEDPLIANNTIVDNTTTSGGGSTECAAISQIYPAPYAYGSSGPSAVIVNNIISGSTPYPAVNCSWFSAPSEALQPTFQNNILYNAGGPFFGSYCIDVSSKYNNIVADPQFVSPTNGDYRLKSTSPAIDTGQNSAVNALLANWGSIVSVDFNGNPRIQNATGRGCIVDMGAFEYPGTLSSCSTAETLVSSLNPSTIGQSVTFTVQLSSGTGVPVGSVQFSDGNTVLGNVPVSSAGTAAFTTSQLIVGSHTIVAAYQPTGSFAASTASLVQVVNGYGTTTTLNCSPASIGIQSMAQLSVSVKSSNGTPTGAINFADNGTSLGTQVLAGGGTNFSYTGLVAGTHTLTATYIPIGNFAGSSSSCSESVTLLPSASVLSVRPASATYGSPVTLTAAVSPLNAPGPSAPAGAVTFYNGNSSIGTAPLANGAASIVLSTLPGGSDNLSCVYSGSSVYLSSSCNTILFPVSPAASFLSLSSSASPAGALSPVTFTAHLSQANGQPAPGNLVTLSVAGQTISLTTDGYGLGQFTTSTLTPGTYAVTANFVQTPSLLGSSATLNEVVHSASTQTTVSARPANAYVGQVVTFAATVTSQGSSAQPAPGTITFFDGGVLLGKQPLNGTGTATFTTSTLGVGTHPINATFLPSDDVFSGSTSATVDENIFPSGFTIAISPASITIKDGASATAAIQLVSVGNFAGPLALTYANLPPNATASIQPTPVSLTARGTGSSTLTLNTLLRVSYIAPDHQRGPAATFAALSLLLVPLGFARRTRLAGLLGIVLLASALQVITGCTNDWYTASTVAPGSYPLTVTATDLNHNSQTATLTLVVTP